MAQAVQGIFFGLFWPLKKGPTGCPKMSVANYQSTLCNAQESKVIIYIAAEAWNHAYFVLTTHHASPAFFFHIVFDEVSFCPVFEIIS
jgi:hypothetical protein